MSKGTRKIIIVLIAIVLAACVLWGVYSLLRPKGISGEKRITVEVFSKDGVGKEFQLNTAQAFLRGALEEEDLIQGSEFPTGLMVTTVNGYEADDANQEWWSFTKEKEFLLTGVDTTPLADGDHFEITLTTGYSDF